MKRCLVFAAVIISGSTLFAQQEQNTYTNDFPNYHPLVVHFPVVLLILTAVMQIAVLFVVNKWYNYAITGITVTGFVTALLASTIFHAEPANNVSLNVKHIFEMHEKLAYATVWISGIAAVCKIAGIFTNKKWLEAAVLIFLLASAITVSLAGHKGSELVYKAGVGPQGEKLKHQH